MTGAATPLQVLFYKHLTHSAGCYTRIACSGCHQLAKRFSRSVVAV